MRRILLSMFVMILTINVNAQSKKKKDQNAIKSMCGCYQVAFNFAETFEYSEDENYQPSKVKHDKGLEWVQLVEDSKNKIVMQHLLIVGKPSKQHVIKHWRQDWLYENTNLYEYDHNNKWSFVSLPKKAVKGQWTQKVFQVDDSPRYEGSASWIHTDGKSFWENTTSAPLPRREYTKRSDYNVTLRTNRHEIVANGWIHDQDNEKIIRENGKKDVTLAEEKGLNEYVKVDDSLCQAAQDWWTKNKQSWAQVRSEWDRVFAESKDLELAPKVEGKPLYRHLFDKEFDFTQDAVNKTIQSFVISK